METKLFGDKKITIRKLAKTDLKNAPRFKDFINSLIQEDAKIGMNKKLSLKEEREFYSGVIKRIKNKSRVYIVAEYNNKIVGTASVGQLAWRQNHIGSFGIVIRDGYRGLGLGEYMLQQVIALAKRELRPKPKMIRLEVYVTNKPAISLYKKSEFKIVARIPKQLQYKGKLVDEFVMLKEV